MITKYNDYCIICGSPRQDIHHIFKGHKQRHLADEDKLLLPLCREHHEAVHQRKEMNVLCEIIGQLAWERDYISEHSLLPFDDMTEEAREAFRYRYGRSYL